jgi:periodic tryptophan protein 2
MQNDAKLNCAAFHAPSNLLVVGFSNGLFGLYELPDFTMIHMLRYDSIADAIWAPNH